MNITEQFNACHSTRRADARRQDFAVNWRAMLPVTWRSQVVVPVVFSRFRDYEILSERTLGYESEDDPCYCEHYVVLTDLRSDDDVEFYLSPSYAEHLVAWRLIDGRWLIFRRISCAEGCEQHQQFFSFADEMPR